MAIRQREEHEQVSARLERCRAAQPHRIKGVADFIGTRVLDYLVALGVDAVWLARGVMADLPDLHRSGRTERSFQRWNLLNLSSLFDRWIAHEDPSGA